MYLHEMKSDGVGGRDSEMIALSTILSCGSLWPFRSFDDPTFYDDYLISSGVEFCQTKLILSHPRDYDFDNENHSE